LKNLKTFSLLEQSERKKPIKPIEPIRPIKQFVKEETINWPG
jgi:hypothetical protein